METSVNEIIKQRALVREENIPEKLLDEYVMTAIDRILLYTGLKVFPEAFNSIGVEIVLAMYRRKYHEGISSEGVDVMSVSFINNLLSEYDREFANYKQSLADDDENNSGAGKLVFL